MKKLLALLIVTLGVFFNTAFSQDVKKYIPEKATPLLPALKSEADRYAPEINAPWYFAALFEHESCLSLKHSRCWSPTSEYKAYDKATGRLIEQGVGLGQTTRAWRATGTLRFDTLASMKNVYRTALKDLNWDNIKQKPELQMRIGILLTMENYRALSSITDPTERLYMADAAYNGGIGDLRKERTLCGLRPNCDPQKWFGHVEKIVHKSTKPVHNGRSSYEVNRHHVKDVFFTRAPKYMAAFNKLE